jgi:hypothetical protein
MERVYVPAQRLNVGALPANRLSVGAKMGATPTGAEASSPSVGKGENKGGRSKQMSVGPAAIAAN